MKIEDKRTITHLRTNGVSYSQIALRTGINKSTVKSFCRRNGLVPGKQGKPKIVRITQGSCRQCGVTVIQYPGRKEKKFCSDRCRNTWWNRHLNEVKRKAMYEYDCPTCGMKFSTYSNRNRKYCSHECYIKDRFG